MRQVMLIVSSSDVVGDVREGVIVQGEEPASEKAARHDVYPMRELICENVPINVPAEITRHVTLAGGGVRLERGACMPV